jgi:hypothetical protein
MVGNLAAVLKWPRIDPMRATGAVPDNPDLS